MDEFDYTLQGDAYHYCDPSIERFHDDLLEIPFISDDNLFSRTGDWDTKPLLLLFSYYRQSQGSPAVMGMVEDAHHEIDESLATLAKQNREIWDTFMSLGKKGQSLPESLGWQLEANHVKAYETVRGILMKLGMHIMRKERATSVIRPQE